MAAISATVLSVSFLLAALVGVDRDGPAWFTAISLVVAIIMALTVASAIASDTAASRRIPRRPGNPSDN